MTNVPLNLETTMQEASMSTANGTSYTKRYRRYVLFMLTVVYALNFIDRQILVILQESIKADMELSFFFGLDYRMISKIFRTWVNFMFYYLKDFNTYLVDHKKRKRDFKLIKLKLFLIRKKDLIIKTLFHKEYRNWFINDILIRLKLKKLAY